MFLSVLNGMTLEDKTHHLASTWKGLSIYSDNQTREQMLQDKKNAKIKTQNNKTEPLMEVRSKGQQLRIPSYVY